MPTVVQFRRGTTTQNNNFTGADGEISVDTTALTLRVHNGSTVGGNPLATQTYVDNAISALSSNSITDGNSNVKVYANGNVATTVAGTANVLVVNSSGAIVTGNISATSNVIVGSASNAQIYMNVANVHIDNNTSTGNITFRANVSGGGVTEVFKVLGTGGVGVTGGIVNLSANTVGNIGSATRYFNTVFAKATSAQYADLAEMYVSDKNYAPGTVVEFGGEHEITISSASHSTAVAGIVSTNPSYLMNSEQTGEHVLAVALTGRVPCQVQGPVRKGDVLVASATPGVAQRIGMNWQPGCILGKSMQVIESAEICTIEVAVGRT
jgi:hypothetical protein